MVTRYLELMSIYAFSTTIQETVLTKVMTEEAYPGSLR